MEILLVGMLVGLDNLAVASGLGVLGIAYRRRLWFAISCTCFETLMPVLGLLIGLELRSQIGPAVEWIGPIFLCAAGVLVLAAVFKKQENTSILNQPVAMILLPLILSLDNLTAGVGLGTSGSVVIMQAIAIGAISGSMSLAGFAIGGRIRFRSALHARVFAGGWLIGCAIFPIFFRDLL